MDEMTYIWQAELGSLLAAHGTKGLCLWAAQPGHLEVLNWAWNHGCATTVFYPSYYNWQPWKTGTLQCIQAIKEAFTEGKEAIDPYAECLQRKTNVEQVHAHP
jgi:hypothetical protein